MVIESCSAAFRTCRSLNWLIPLDFCSRLVFLASWGLESVSATAHVCRELRGLEWKVTGITALSLKLLLCWELTVPDATIERGLSTDGNDEEVADEHLLVAFGKDCFGGF
jgi:hypothetical protein